jgi:16S rRNA (cytidine1402-2'-O)-methyltransferase
MSLTVVSTPIGHPDDITLRAIEVLKSSDAIICEEIRPAQTLLKRIGISATTPDHRPAIEGAKPLYQLNEHARPSDLAPLLELCKHKNVALISDCGTPGFCDPGADLVSECAKNKIVVTIAPGASSLMALLALSGEKISEFHFVGFLPAEKEERRKKLERLKNTQVPLVVMDTPYRFKTTVLDFSAILPKARVVAGADLTAPQEFVFRGSLVDLAKKDVPKAPFVLLILPH